MEFHDWFESASHGTPRYRIMELAVLERDEITIEELIEDAFNAGMKYKEDSLQGA